MDYGTDDAKVSQDLALDKTCDLPESVQKLIIKIFDVNVMKKTLLEFEVRLFLRLRFSDIMGILLIGKKNVICKLS